MSRKLSLQDVVQQQMSKVGIGGSPASIVWGSFATLESADLEQLNRSALKSHLTARGIEAIGTKPQLVKKLRASVEEERQSRKDKAEKAEEKHRRIADLEESGAVYVTGKNHQGQLGLGDLKDRSFFTVIGESRGLRVKNISSNSNMCFAVSENDCVYAWGGSGVGPMGIDSVKSKAQFESPQRIASLDGEEITQVSAGNSHVLAVSRGGDMYCWGRLCPDDANETGSLPTLMGSISDIPIETVAVGAGHCCALTNDGSVFAWGQSSNGRLGLGNYIAEATRSTGSVSSPQLVTFPFPDSSACIKSVTCGAEHTVVVSSCGRAYSWGSGDGGRLGHGDFADRHEPTMIMTLNDMRVLEASCGIWHSGCIAVRPPMIGAGLLYTFGSGFHGQLGQGDTTVSPKPALVSGFVERHLLVKKISCGSHHNAVIADDGELYTFGSNESGCLGRKLDGDVASFSPDPGRCDGFGSLCGRIGRGMPLSVTCGKHFTAVASSPYCGPDEEAAKKLMEQQQLMKETSKLEEKAHDTAQTDEERKADELAQRRAEVLALTSKRLCTADPTCPGFMVDAYQPSICKECGHSLAHHTIVVDEDAVAGSPPSST